MSAIAANAVADRLALDVQRPAELLDVAVGSGVCGFTALQRYPQARLTSLDWANVLAALDAGERRLPRALAHPGSDGRLERDCRAAAGVTGLVVRDAGCVKRDA